MKINLADQLTVNKKKREAIEQLIQFAKQLVVAGDGLEALQFAALPSQKVADSHFDHQQQMLEQFRSVDTKQLKQRLLILDQVLVKDVHSILEISQLSEEAHIQRFTQSSIDTLDHYLIKLQQQLDDFRRKAQTNVAIRLSLQGRGMPVTAVRLPVPQEQLAEQLVELRKRENQCREKIKRGVDELLLDTTVLLANGLFSETSRHELQQTQRQLQLTLEHLEKGGDIEELPFSIEVGISDDDYQICSAYGDQVPATGHKLAKQGKAFSTAAKLDQDSVQEKTVLNTTEDDHTDAQAVMTEKASTAPPLPANSDRFFARLKRWLMSPWSVSWADIKQQEQRHKKQK